MRHFIASMVWLLVCATCKAVGSQEIAVENVVMSFHTNTEQYHKLYGAGDFVVKTDNDNCTPLKIPHSISIRKGRLIVDAGEDAEEVYKINSCTYAAGKVFKDRGTQEVYTLSCSDNDGGLAAINISEVKDGNRSQTIVCITSFDENGVPVSITTLHD